MDLDGNRTYTLSPQNLDPNMETSRMYRNIHIHKYAINSSRVAFIHIPIYNDNIYRCTLYIVYNWRRINMVEDKRLFYPVFLLNRRKNLHGMIALPRTDRVSRNSPSRGIRPHTRPSQFVTRDSRKPVSLIPRSVAVRRTEFR